jgi:hypothetical protein
LARIQKRQTLQRNHGLAGPRLCRRRARGIRFFAFATIGDIGGGLGHLLRAVLEKTPRSRGILFDLPNVVESAKQFASDRFSVQGGDFFKDALPRCDAYLLMDVIHAWGDRIPLGARRADQLRHVTRRGFLRLDAARARIEGATPATVNASALDDVPFQVVSSRSSCTIRR